jgi:hypothetical protein
MRLATLAFSFGPLFAASLAHAQAPGEVQPVVIAPVIAQPVVVAPVIAQPVVVAPVVAQPVVMAPVAPVAPAAPVAGPIAEPMVAPGTAPVVPENGCAMPCTDCRESVMANRWSIGLSLGSMSLSPKSSPDDKTAFALGELSLRFRVTPHFELEASAGGGREQTSDGMDGDLEVNTAVIAARWRFRPEAAWNWFVMGGIGGASVTRHDASKQERSDATQPLGMLGIGLERRFRHLALHAELRAVGLGTSKKDQPADPPIAQPAMTTTMPPAPTTADIERSGGSLTVGLSYYF